MSQLQQKVLKEDEDLCLASYWRCIGERVGLYTGFNKDAVLIYSPCPFNLIAGKIGAYLLNSKYKRVA